MQTFDLTGVTQFPLVVSPKPKTKIEEVQDRVHQIKTAINMNDPVDAWALSLILGDMIALHKKWEIGLLVHETITRQSKS